MTTKRLSFDIDPRNVPLEDVLRDGRYHPCLDASSRLLLQNMMKQRQQDKNQLMSDKRETRNHTETVKEKDR